MKKTYLLFSAFMCLGFHVAIAQYTILHSFDNTDGALPAGALTRSSNILFGMTNEGGANNLGCIFSIDTTGANYKDIFDFNGENGQYPQGGTLKISGNKLFGMVYGGGAIDSGCVFSVDTDGTNYKDLLDFTGLNGASPIGSLTLSGTKLFGMTFTGGVNVMGNVFTVDTNGNNYRDLLDFNGTNGLNPYGDVTLIGDKLYGMTNAGGVNAAGNIFSMDTNGSNYADLFDFNGSDGLYCNNLLVPGGSQFFGMTFEGGLNADGNVFSIDTNGTAFKDLADFAGSGTAVDGLNPDGDVMLSGNTLYGMTEAGGSSDSGCIFSIDTNGAGYTDLFDFTNATGYIPYSNVTLSGNIMYGTASTGGANGYGVIFRFHYVNSGINTIKNNPSVNLYPNPNNGQFTLHTSQGAGSSCLEIFDMLGEKIYSSNLAQGETLNSVNISTQPAGIYFYRLIRMDPFGIANSGELIGEGKIDVQK